MIATTGTHRILAVDDDKGYLRLLERTLQDDGFEVTTVTSGQQAIEAAEAQQPDLILLDVCMPDLDGRETCRRLKANDCTTDLPVIFLTAQQRTHENLAQAFSVGACDYITKPLSRGDVLFRVRRAIQLHQERLRLQSLETHDLVTGLPGRGYLRTRVGQAWADASRHDCDVSILLAQIDPPSQTADTNGQGASDLLPRRFAPLLQSEAFGPDIVGLWEPDAFMFILPRLGLDSAVAAASRIAAVWRLMETPCNGNTLTSTVSFGVATRCPSDPDASSRSLIHSAEVALARAREAGGDRVAIARSRSAPTDTWIVSLAEHAPAPAGRPPVLATQAFA